MRSYGLVECVKQIELDHFRIFPVILRGPCGRSLSLPPPTPNPSRINSLFSTHYTSAGEFPTYSARF